MSINLIQGQRSNYTWVQELLAIENGFSNMEKSAILDIASTAEMYSRDVIISFKETITTIQGYSFKKIRQKCWKDVVSRFQEENKRKQ